MKPHHEDWLALAAEYTRAKRYDDARDYAMRVLREDGRNTRALWIVASVTDSLPERRNALKALLRIDPENLPARRLLDSIEPPTNTTPTAAKTTGVIRSIKPN